jgi:transposase
MSIIIANGKMTDKERALQMSLGGTSLGEIGEQFGVSESTASRWVNEAKTQQIELLQAKLNATQAREDSAKAERNNLRQQCDELKEQLSSLQEAREDATEVRKTLEAYQEALKGTSTDLQEARQELAAIRSAHESACTELSTLRQELGSFQQTKQHLANAQQQLKQMREAEAARKRAWLINIFQGQNFMSLIVLVGGISLAVAITAPIFISVGVPDIPAYAMSIYVDIACFIFVLNNRHRLGIGFSIATAVQALIKLGGLNWMEPSGLVIVKAAVLAIALGLATYGFSDLIASKKSTH